MDFLDGWSSTLFQEWNVARTEIDVEFGHYCESGYALLSVSSNANANLLSAQRSFYFGIGNWVYLCSECKS